MIRLTYKCQVCGFGSSVLNEAQEHANTKRHVVDISGEMTPSEESLHVSDAIAPHLAKQVRENAVMRLAKQRGLIPNVKKGGR